MRGLAVAVLVCAATTARADAWLNFDVTLAVNVSLAPDSETTELAFGGNLMALFGPRGAHPRLGLVVAADWETSSHSILAAGVAAMPWVQDVGGDMFDTRVLLLSAGPLLDTSESTNHGGLFTRAQVGWLGPRETNIKVASATRFVEYRFIFADRHDLLVGIAVNPFVPIAIPRTS